MRDGYVELLAPTKKTEEDKLVGKLVKAADRISAYLKCVSEESLGNSEFSSAKLAIKETIDKIELPEVSYFMDNFVPSYGMTLDQISN